MRENSDPPPGCRTAAGTVSPVAVGGGGSHWNAGCLAGSVAVCLIGLLACWKMTDFLADFAPIRIVCLILLKLRTQLSDKVILHHLHA